MQEKFDAKTLINRYRSGLCSAEEKAIVESWHIQSIRDAKYVPDEAELSRVGESIWAALPLHERRTKQSFPLWAKYMSAACLLLIAFILVYQFYDTGDDYKNGMVNTTIKSGRYQDDVVPGGNKARLTLADGKELVLDGAADGLLANQGSADIKKTADGQLIYIADRTKHAAVLNTLSTPKGGQYRLTLPDGTRVFLNSASSITYPTVFNGSKRSVKLSGEAYLEVAANKDFPFEVQTDRQIIKVLGTHFNVSNYQDEGVAKTTLIEGKVKIVVAAREYQLLPGQQATVNQTKVHISNEDVDQAVAWMHGDFIFRDENIQSIMRKLERWYDIEVAYEGSVKDVDFGAEISRNKNLSQVLKILEETGGAHFKIEGRRVTVMP